MSRFAILDLGTNSVRLDIYQLFDDASYELLHRGKTMVRLGQEVFTTGVIQTDACERCFDALDDFARQCEEFAVTDTIAIGTCALREAENAADFVKQVKKRFGYKIRVIAGEEEAELILMGIQKDPMSAFGVYGFVDIGGGSTEIGVVKPSKTVYLESFDFGAARMKQLFLMPTVKSDAIAAMRSYIQEDFADRPLPKKFPTIEHLLGSSGTIRAVRSILEANGRGKRIKLKHLSKLSSEMSTMTRKEILAIPGLPAKRADIILPGIIILQETMIFLRTNVVHFTKFALRDGIIRQYVESQFEQSSQASSA